MSVRNKQTLQEKTKLLTKIKQMKSTHTLSTINSNIKLIERTINNNQPKLLNEKVSSISEKNLSDCIADANRLSRDLGEYIIKVLEEVKTDIKNGENAKAIEKINDLLY